MNHRLLRLPVAALALSACAALPASASAHPAGIAWGPCPHYSDVTFKYLVGPDQLAEFKALWRRTECGTVQVPLNYVNPHGRRITIALTRLRATGRAHRLGSLAVNPGGPGGSGYLMPLHMVTAQSNDIGKQLNTRYDLIGFDPRGVGYSTKVDCPDPPPQPPREVGPMTEDYARRLYSVRMQANQACVKTNPDLLSQQTTTNVARDLDAIRSGLHERRISFLGISWGTLLGAVYRSLYPSHVQRMWLDSPAAPFDRVDAYEDGRADAMAKDFARFADWLAQRDTQFGFGTTAAQVTTALTQLREQLDANPRVYSDLQNVPVDGSLVAQAAGGFSLSWPLAGPLLKALRDTPSGMPAPPEVQQAFGDAGNGNDDGGGTSGGGGDSDQQPPADLPEDFNPTMNAAAICNEDAGRRDLTTAWADWQRRLRLYPVTGEAGYPIPQCAGWNLPVHPLPLRRTTASLVMSAHRYELLSPYPWGLQMQRAIGGQILTVGDDVHSSAAGMDTDCAPLIPAYFFTGRLQRDHCQGIAIPTASDAPQSSGG